MTGNNKVWRAPVAGLASVAMLATLGVSAMTANAAATDPKITWVNADGTSYTQTDAQADGRIDLGDLNPSGHYETDMEFAGWFTAPGVGNGERVEPGTKITEDTTIYEHAAYPDAIWTVEFTASDKTSDPQYVNGVQEYEQDNDNYQTVVANGDKLADWQIPSADKRADGKIVDGWMANGNPAEMTGNPADDATKVNGVATGTVTYSENVVDAYTVKFHQENAQNDVSGAYQNYSLTVDGQSVTSLPYSVDVKKGTVYTGSVPVATISNDGRIASQWKTARANKDKIGSVATFNPSTDAVNSNLDLYPYAAVEHFQVTFDYQDNNKTADKVVDVAKGSTVSAPADPTRAEDSKYVYEFGGWYTNSNCADNTKYDFSKKIDGTVNLYAKWNIVAVKVTFVPNYGSEKPIVVAVKAGDKLTAPEVTREGYQLTAWKNTNDGTTDGTVYQAAQGYPLSIDQTAYGDTPAATLQYTTSDGADGVSSPTTVTPKFTAVWTSNAEAIKDYEQLVDVDLDADKQEFYTADSYKTYVDAFKGDYLAAKTEAAKGGLSSDEYASLIAQLKDMQSKLVEVGDTELYRVYNPNNGDHYFTTRKDEADRLVKLGWKAEGAPYKVCKDRTDYTATEEIHRNFGTAVWSVYNPNTGEHLLTFEAEADALANKGWVKEDLKFYTVQNGSQDVVRVYNPNTSGPAHLYTKMSEASILAGKGWIIDNNAKPVFTLD